MEVWVPDDEARRLAWERAERVGARAKYEPVRSLQVVRAHRWNADPASILDDPPDFSPPTVAEAAATMVKALQPIIVTMTSAIERFNSVMAETGDNVRVFLDKLNEQQSVPNRRHGSAALCPRHGPTRGGACHRCARQRIRHAA